MSRLTPNFSREEFQCKGTNCDGNGNNCGKDTVDVQLMQAQNLLRHHFNQPVTITSGFRCPKHNKAIGGAENSLHMEGKAADFKVKDTTTREVYEFLDKTFPDRYGIGFYSGWIHLDVRETKARWVS